MERERRLAAEFQLSKGNCRAWCETLPLDDTGTHLYNKAGVERGHKMGRGVECCTRPYGATRLHQTSSGASLVPQSVSSAPSAQSFVPSQSCSKRMQAPSDMQSSSPSGHFSGLDSVSGAASDSALLTSASSPAGCSNPDGNGFHNSKKKKRKKEKRKKEKMINICLFVKCEIDITRAVAFVGSVLTVPIGITEPLARNAHAIILALEPVVLANYRHQT